MDTQLIPQERPVVKGGAVTATVDAGTRGDVQVTFDEPFPEAPYVTATITSGTGPVGMATSKTVEVYLVTETWFTIGLYNGTSSQALMKADWIAVLP